MCQRIMHKKKSSVPGCSRNQGPHDSTPNVQALLSVHCSSMLHTTQDCRHITQPKFQQLPDSFDSIVQVVDQFALCMLKFLYIFVKQVKRLGNS